MSHRCPGPLLACHTELFHHGDELQWTAVLGHDPPQALTTDSVEGLVQIDVELPWTAVLGHDPPQALTTDSVEGLVQIDVELPWTAVLGHDPPQALTTDSVEGLGQIDVGGEQVGILLLIFLRLAANTMSMVPCS